MSILYNGDCLIEMGNIADNSVDCIITDPPYFIHKLGNDWNSDEITKRVSRAGVVGGLPTGMKFSPQQGRDLQEYMNPVAKEIIRVLKPGGFCLVFSQARLSNRMGNSFEDAGFELRDMLFWKRSSQPKAFSHNHFVKKMDISQDEKDDILESLDNRKTPQLMQELEPIILFQKPREGTFVNNWIKYGVGMVNVDFEDGFPSTILEYSRDYKVNHLTPKPVELIKRLLEIFTKEDDLVLDTFMGSGSTGVACKLTKRRFIGIEIDEGYYNLAKDRIEGCKYGATKR